MLLNTSALFESAGKQGNLRWQMHLVDWEAHNPKRRRRHEADSDPPDVELDLLLAEVRALALRVCPPSL